MNFASELIQHPNSLERRLTMILVIQKCDSKVIERVMISDSCLELRRSGMLQAGNPPGGFITVTVK